MKGLIITLLCFAFSYSFGYVFENQIRNLIKYTQESLEPITIKQLKDLFSNREEEKYLEIR